MKKIIVLAISFLSFFFLTSAIKVQANDTYRIWFYNSAGWSSVSTYIYKVTDTGIEKPLGEWPGQPATQDDNTRWWYLDVNFEQPFNIIFNNGGGAQTSGAYIEDTIHVYITVIADQEFASKEEAEDATKDYVVDPNAKTTLWFYNSNGWEDVYLYVYGTLTENVLGPWPGKQAKRDGDDYWYSIEVPSQLPFNAIFNNGTDQVKAEAYINDEENIYITVVTDVKYASKKAAEDSIEIVLPIPEKGGEDQTPIELTDEETLTMLRGSFDKMLTIIFIVSFVFSILLTGCIVFLLRKFAKEK